MLFSPLSTFFYSLKMKICINKLCNCLTISIRIRTRVASLEAQAENINRLVVSELRAADSSAFSPAQRRVSALELLSGSPLARCSGP